MQTKTERSLEVPVETGGARTRVERARKRLGEVFDGKWRLDTLLGVGGSAAVYAATHRNTKRAALKILHPELHDSPELVARFMREGYVANQIDHPGAVAIADDDTADDGSVYLVMELLYGKSLDKLAAWAGSYPTLTLNDVVRIGDELLDVLAIAHAQGIVHRDVKPANLFLTVGRQLKVLDFGIARLADALGDGAATQPGTLVGTPAYMPPEQARGQWRKIDARSDLWAVGATMFALLTGRRPRQAETGNEELYLAMTAPVDPIAQVEPRLPRAIAEFVDKAVAIDMDARWQDARSMQKALRAAAASAAGESAPALVSPDLAPKVAVPGATAPVRTVRIEPMRADAASANALPSDSMQSAAMPMVAPSAASPMQPRTVPLPWVPSGVVAEPPAQSTTQHAVLAGPRPLPYESHLGRVFVGLVAAAAAVSLVLGVTVARRAGVKWHASASQSAPSPIPSAASPVVRPPPAVVATAPAVPAPPVLRSPVIVAPPPDVAPLAGIGATSATPTALVPAASASVASRPSPKPPSAAERARAVMLSDPDAAKAILMPSVARGSSTRDETELLLTICKTLKDRSCVDACIIRLGLDESL